MSCCWPGGFRNQAAISGMRARGGKEDPNPSSGAPDGRASLISGGYLLRLHGCLAPVPGSIPEGPSPGWVIPESVLANRRNHPAEPRVERSRSWAIPIDPERAGATAWVGSGRRSVSAGRVVDARCARGGAEAGSETRRETRRLGRRSLAGRENADGTETAGMETKQGARWRRRARSVGGWSCERSAAARSSADVREGSASLAASHGLARIPSTPSSGSCARRRSATNAARSVFEQAPTSRFGRAGRSSRPTSWFRKYFRGHVGTPERKYSVKQLIWRVVGRVREWGEKSGYTAPRKTRGRSRTRSPHLLVTQRMAFNSPVWFNLG